MSCCTVDGTGDFFSKSAGYYARKFQRRGLDRVQRIIRDAIAGAWQPGQTVLEIGCATGGLLLALLQSGARSATGIDLSPRMIEKARDLAGEFHLGDRVRYLVGDFGAADGQVDPADIVILDKVVCCTNDPFTLLARAAAKCVHVLVVSYPRDALLGRLSFTTQAFIGEALRWTFHPVYHEPSDLDQAIASQGFRQVLARHRPIWEIKRYERVS